MRSAGPYSVVDLYFAGGVPAVEKILEPYLDTSVRNVAGTILHDVIKGIPIGLPKKY